MENDVLNQNSDEFKRVVVGKQMAGQDDHHGNNQDEQQLQGTGNNNTLLALQEIQGPSNPVRINGDHVVSSEVVEEVKEKPKLMVTNDLKPRLQWTQELHACFVDAVNQLGGPHKATPKAVLEVMDIERLSVFHIKSHLQAEKHNQRCQDAQRSYLETTVDGTSKKLADQYLGNATLENAIMYERALASLGTFTTIPGPSDLGIAAPMRQFHFNQQNAYSTYDTLTTHANLSLQEVPFGYQPQISLYPPPKGFSTSYGYSVSSYQETLPALAGNGKRRVQPVDEDPIEAFLNWDDNEPKNLNADFNYNDLRGFPGTF